MIFRLRRCADHAVETNRHLCHEPRFGITLALSGIDASGWGYAAKAVRTGPVSEVLGIRAGRVASSPLKQRGRHFGGMASRADSKLPVAACAVGAATDWKHIPHGGRKESAMKRKMSDTSGVPTHIPQVGNVGGMSENPRFSLCKKCIYCQRRQDVSGRIL